MSKCPTIIPRRPYWDDWPDGYLEGDNCWVENNKEAAVWFLKLMTSEDADMPVKTTGHKTAKIIDALTAENALLRAELQAYRDARKYDACMSGAVFKGWNRSQLDRARRMTEQQIKEEASSEE